MKKNLATLTFCLSFSFSTIYAATIRDNIICFAEVDKVLYTPQNSLYNNESYSITSDQPWESITQDRYYPACLDIRAGRKANTTNVDWVKNTMNYNPGNIEWNSSNMSCSGFNNGTPTELNFAFTGTFTFQIGSEVYTCPNIEIGQGSNGSLENMWIFANNNSDNKSKGLYISCYSSNKSNSMLKFSRLSGSMGDVFAVSRTQ